MHASLSWHHRPLSDKHLSRYFQGDVLKTATEESKQLKKDILKQLKVSNSTGSSTAVHIVELCTVL